MPRRPTKVRRKPGRPPASDATATRELLLNAALTLFAERGFSGASVREIARAAGVTDPAIYAHFTGKKAIFDALMEQGGPALLGGGEFDAARAASEPPEAVLPRLFDDLIAAWSKPRVRLFTSVLLREGARGVDAALRDVQRELQPAVEKWMKSGHLRRDVAANTATWELIAPLATIRLTLLNAHSSDADRARARSLARAHVDYFLRTAGGS